MDEPEDKTYSKWEEELLDSVEEQTDLLSKINDKLGFFTILVIIPSAVAVVALICVVFMLFHH